MNYVGVVFARIRLVGNEADAVCAFSCVVSELTFSQTIVSVAGPSGRALMGPKAPCWGQC
mgnify:CR=1 FL=1